MKTWAEFHSLVLPSVLGCPIPTMDNALRLTARDFCKRTREWRESESFTAQGIVNLFDIDIPPGTELVRIISADVAGEPLDIFGRGELPTDWATCTPPDGLYHVGTTEYRVFPVPPANARITIESALMPSNTGTGVGDDVFDRYAEAIADGALCRLMKMPRQPWSDINLAGIHDRDYERAVHHAANRDFAQTAPAQRRVKPQG